MDYDRRHLTDAELEVAHRESIRLMDLLKKRDHRPQSLHALEERHAEIIREMQRRGMI